MLPPPPARLTFGRESLGRALRAVPKDAVAVLTLPIGEAPVGLAWEAKGIIQGRRLTPNRTEVHAPRQVVLPLPWLAAICKASRAEDLEIEVRQAELVVHAGPDRHEITAEWRLLEPDVPRRPIVPDILADDQTWTVPASVLMTALARVVPVVPRPGALEMKHLARYPAIIGLEVELEPGGVRLTATDGRRLASQDLRAERSGFSSGSAVLPPHAIRPLIEFCRSAGDSAWIDLGISEGGWVNAQNLRTEETFAADAVRGRFPEWRKALPSTRNARLVFRANELARAAKTAEALIRKSDSDGWTIPGLAFAIGEDGRSVDLTLRTLGDVTRQTVPLIAAEAESGRFPPFTLSPLLLNDFTRLVAKDSGEVMIDYCDRASAVALGGITGLTYLVMPLISDEDLAETEDDTPEVVSPPEPSEAEDEVIVEAPTPTSPESPEPVVAIAAASVPTADREPCLDCGTTGGTINPKTGQPARRKGRCTRCYNAFRKPAKMAVGA